MATDRTPPHLRLPDLAKEIARDKHESFRRRPDETSVDILGQIVGAATITFADAFRPFTTDMLAVTLISDKLFWQTRRHPGSKLGRHSYELGRRLVLQHADITEAIVPVTIGRIILSQRRRGRANTLVATIVDRSETGVLRDEYTALTAAVDELEHIHSNWPPLQPHITLGKINPLTDISFYLAGAEELSAQFMGRWLNLEPISLDVPPRQSI